MGRPRGGREEAMGPCPKAVLEATGAVGERLGEHSGVEVEDWFRQALGAGRGRDAAAGATLAGPHRSDLAIRHGEKNLPAMDCSTGEQKALLISIIMANARVHRAAGKGAPILLLDEVAAHLDGDRRAALVAQIAGFGTQAWLTGTDRALFESFGDRAQFYDVCEGRVRDHP